jgi:AcrR family transcriptional regulator
MAVPAQPPATKRPRGRPPRTEAQREAHRTRLVESAMEAIRALGADLSIDDIAARAGVSKPVLYDEFGGRLGIADAISVVITERLEQQVADELAGGAPFDLSAAVRLFVAAVVNFIDAEPALYSFLVRSIRTPERGFLDNALVAGIHERSEMVGGFVAPDLPEDHLRVLTDGVFGFVFAAVESWQVRQAPPKEELIDTLAQVIRVGFRGVSERIAEGKDSPT